jgi:hypothetical protein
MLIQSLVSQLVQLPCTYVLLQLLVPALGIEFGEPLAELCQFLGGELGNGSFDFVESHHTDSLSRVFPSVNGKPRLPAQRSGGHWIYERLPYYTVGTQLSKTEGSKTCLGLLPACISLKERGGPTHRIELVKIPFTRRFRVRRNGTKSTQLPQATATEVAEEIHCWLAKQASEDLYSAPDYTIAHFLRDILASARSTIVE